MKIKFILVIIVTVLIICTCTENQNSNELIPIIQKSKFEDSSYISFAYDIYSYEGDYYVSDFKNYRILVLDSNLIVKKSIGVYGKGPGEFTAVGGINICRDTIYAFDPNKNKFNLFGINGNFIKELEPQYPIYRKFFISNDRIIYCHPYSEEPFVELDLNGKLIRSFGQMTKKYDDEEKYSTNQWDVFEYGDSIVVVNITDPVIDIYNNKLDLIKRVDFSNSELFSSMFKFKKEKIKNDINMRRSTFSIITNACLDGNKLYLLYYSRENDKTIANKLLIYDLLNNQFSSPIILKSRTGEEFKYITAISAINNNIIVFDIDTGTIAKYNITNELTNEKL